MKYMIPLFVFLSLLSCKSDLRNLDNQGKVSIKSNLPASIPVNESVEGEFLYSSSFDGIELKQNEDRFITLYLVKSRNQVSNIENLKKITLKDTFVRIENNIIPIYDLKFDQKGQMFLEGYIIDELYLNNPESEDILIKTIETKLSHSIIVE